MFRSLHSFSLGSPTTWCLVAHSSTATLDCALLCSVATHKIRSSGHASIRSIRTVFLVIRKSGSRAATLQIVARNIMRDSAGMSLRRLTVRSLRNPVWQEQLPEPHPLSRSAIAETQSSLQHHQSRSPGKHKAPASSDLQRQIDLKNNRLPVRSRNFRRGHLLRFVNFHVALQKFNASQNVNRLASLRSGGGAGVARSVS